MLEKAIRKLRQLVKMLQKDIMLHGTEKDGVVSVIMFFKSVSTAYTGPNGHPSPDIKSKSAVVRGKS